MTKTFQIVSHIHCKVLNANEDFVIFMTYELITYLIDYKFFWGSWVGQVR